MNIRGLAVARALMKINLLKQEADIQFVYSVLSDLHGEKLCQTVHEMIISERFIIGNFVDKETLLDELYEIPITLEELRLTASQPLNMFLSFDELLG
ncbi:hypothetical protein EAMG_05325 [Escherichia coli M056]|uniref:hypothetical protein n=1 Tax=Escherichia coli TaxID=562 RepID=UPI000A185C62|nr:hypothetical protein [Escherichia coli]OSK14545.1 hypothetical protein EAMG_05325 [Escherichia coli M056]